jgi:hypothetical protein
VVYGTKQQRIKYLVEFWLPEDGYRPDYRLDDFIPEIEHDDDNEQVTDIGKNLFSLEFRLTIQIPTVPKY